MCGIFGCVKTRHSSVQNGLPSLIIRALNLLKNRGYDSCGVFLTDGLTEYITKFGVDGEIIKQAQTQESGIADIFVLLEKHLW